MSNNSSQSKPDHNKKIPIIAEKPIGKYKRDDEMIVEKYAARVLVAMGKARFKNEEDEFRKPVAATRKRGRGSHRTRDMSAQ